jgi:hypothetical protein
MKPGSGSPGWLMGYSLDSAESVRRIPDPGRPIVSIGSQSQTLGASHESRRLRQADP